MTVIDHHHGWGCCRGGFCRSGKHPENGVRFLTWLQKELPDFCTLLISCGIILIATSQATLGFCLGWSSLEGYTLMASGEFRLLQCYAFSEKYDCLTWPRNLYEFDGRCYQIHDHGLDGETGLLFAIRGNDNVITQFVTIGMFQHPECHDVTPYVCPTQW